ncbi:MAG: 4Fe-4S binding protein [Thermodesulfovibrionales bacterium]
MKRLRIIFIVILIVSITGGNILRRFTEKPLDETLYLKEIAPDVVFHKKTGRPFYYPSEGEVIAFNSYDVRPDIKGYAGPIKVLLVIDRNGILRGLKILEHRETKNYVYYMETEQYLSQYIGKSIKDPFEIDKDIDGISRATVSVDALARTIRESSRIMASRVFQIEIEEEKERNFILQQWLIYGIFFASGFLFFYLSRRREKFLNSRDIYLLLSIFILGFYLSSPFSIIHIYNLILFRFSSSSLLYLLIFTVMASLVMAGRFYCGWLCPFGAIAEFIGRIPVKKWDIASEKDLRFRGLKYYLLFFITFLVLLTGVPEYSIFETYITLFSFHGNIFQWSLLFLMLLINLKIKRAWCRYFCPVGALSGLVSRRLFGYKGNKKCPVDNPLGSPDSECLRCNRCLRSTV